MTTLTGRVAVVTGGSRGIGAATARRLGGEGAKVVVNYSRTEEAAQTVVGDIQEAGGEALALQADIGQLADITRLLQESVAAFGRLDILINNAGVADFRPLDAVTPELYAELFDVNVRGPLFAMREAARLFDAAGGRIVNISSGITRSPGPLATVYAASKAALETMTACLAHELGPRQITVNAVAPGLTETDMLHAVMSAQAQQALVSQTALGRLGTPQDIADVVVFLVSQEGRWITGQTIFANGGLK